MVPEEGAAGTREAAVRVDDGSSANNTQMRNLASEKSHPYAIEHSAKKS